MRSGLAVSATLHIIVLSIAYFGIPELFEPPPAIPAPIPVELISIGELTTPGTEAPPQPPKSFAKEQPELAEPQPPRNLPRERQAVAKLKLSPPPPPPTNALAALPMEPLPPLKPQPQPEPPRSAPQPLKREAKPPPKPITKPERKPSPRADLGPAPAPRARPRAKAAFDPTRISALLDKSPRQASVQDEEKKRSVDDIKIESKAPSYAPASAPTISELDFIRRQFLDCWYLPGGVKDLRNMRVTIRVELDRDGTLARPPAIVERIGRNAADPTFFRTFEESALRAVRACTDPEKPLQLPSGEPGKWRDLEFTFDPRDMLG